MKRIDKYQIAKELYHDEIDYKSKIDSRFVGNISFLTILGSATVVSIQKAFPLHVDFLHICYYIICVISIISLINSILKFKAAYYNYTYSYIYLSEINKAVESYKKNLQSCGCSEELIVEWSDVYLSKMVTDQYFSSAMQNRQTNLKKSANQKRFIDSLIINFIIIAISFLCQIIIENL